VQLSDRIADVLGRRRQLEAVRQEARATAVRQFDLKTALLPRWMTLFDDLINGRRPHVEPAMGHLETANQFAATPRGALAGPGLRPAAPRCAAPRARPRKALP
jgi:hypothetical protein